MSKFSAAMSGQEEPSPVRQCNWDGCNLAGEFRAPISRERLHEFQYFCHKHIREFNKAWNYFDGWDSDAIMAWRRADTGWHRQTWERDSRCVHPRVRIRVDDVFRLLDEDEDMPVRGVPGTVDTRPFAILGLQPGASREDIRQKFKLEVKACHPDTNGGSRDSEQRLRDVIWAYRALTNRL